jgi:hypothetical protein
VEENHASPRAACTRPSISARMRQTLQSSPPGFLPTIAWAGRDGSVSCCPVRAPPSGWRAVAREGGRRAWLRRCRWSPVAARGDPGVWGRPAPAARATLSSDWPTAASRPAACRTRAPQGRSGDDHDVSEDRLHQIVNALWGLSSFLTMRGNSAVTGLAQGWMLAGVLALDWSAFLASQTACISSINSVSGGASGSGSALSCPRCCPLARWHRGIRHPGAERHQERTGHVTLPAQGRKRLCVRILVPQPP